MAVQRVHSGDNHHDSWTLVLWSTDCLASMAKNVCAIISIITDKGKEPELKLVFVSAGVLGAAVLPGPDAGEGAVAESHGPGAPPAPLPQAVWTPFLHRPPHETLSPPLTPAGPKTCPPPHLKKKQHTHNTHHQGGTALTQPKHPTARWRATDTHTCNREVD